jgi:hypothetical protein
MPRGTARASTWIDGRRPSSYCSDMLSTVIRQGLALGSMLVFCAGARAASVTLQASQDNTLYESTDGSLSNGVGQHLFAGRTAGAGNLRRAVVAFDLTGSVPRGATIESVTLTLNMSMTNAGPQSVELHRLLTAWGEGSSDAPGQEGAGGVSAPADATWLHTFFPDQFWSQPGSDFVPAASATATVDQVAPYSWSSAAMISDLQGWLARPRSNYGWVLLGGEGSPGTAKRFDSREHPDRMVHPALVVAYSSPPEVPALSPMGIAIAALSLMLAAWIVLRRGGRSVA